MLLLIGFAFLAGIVTVLSPCILPVIPVILSGSVGGKARPWGIISGFVLSFTVFTLTLSSLVQALGIDAEVLRWLAAALILTFGLVLVVPVLKDAFMAWTTRLVQRTAPVKPGRPSAGFGAGFALGLGLGAVWTPCVGPIMASVISLALSQSVDASSVFITLAYSLGTAIPLFLIMQGGRTLLTRFSWLTTHSAAIQRGFGVLMLVTAVGLFTGADRAFSTWLLTTFPGYGTGLTSIENQKAVQEELEKRRVAAAPPVDSQAAPTDPLTLGEGEWLNSPPLTLEGLRGQVVLVDFWTYSCINCVRTIPYLRSWYEKYRDQGLVIVGVHSPEFAFERSVTNLRRAMGELKVTWPVVQDNGFGIWNAFQNQYWPAHYLYDRSGTLIETHFGEGNYEETEAAITKALGIAPRPGTPEGTLAVSEAPKTPETYLSYGRGARFASPEEVSTDQPATYSVPSDLAANRWALEGSWTIGKESSQGASGSRLVLNFEGSRVYLVARPAGGDTVQVRIRLDGRDRPPQTIDRDALYTLVDEARRTGGRLELEFTGPVQVFAFTFG